MDISLIPDYSSDPLSILLAREEADDEVEATESLWRSGQARTRGEYADRPENLLGASPFETEWGGDPQRLINTLNHQSFIN